MLLNGYASLSSLVMPARIAKVGERRAESKGCWRCGPLQSRSHTSLHSHLSMTSALCPHEATSHWPGVQCGPVGSARLDLDVKITHSTAKKLMISQGSFLYTKGLEDFKGSFELLTCLKLVNNLSKADQVLTALLCCWLLVNFLHFKRHFINELSGEYIFLFLAALSLCQQCVSHTRNTAVQLGFVYMCVLVCLCVTESLTGGWPTYTCSQEPRADIQYCTNPPMKHG